MKYLWIVAFLIATEVYSQLGLEVVWEKPSEEITDAKFSPDGKFVYCAIGADIKKLDVQMGEFVTTFDNSLSTFIYANVKMNISDDGRYIATSNSNGAIDVWDTQQNKLIKELQLGANMATFKKDNILLIASAKNESRGIIIYDFLKDKYLDTVSYAPAILHIYTSQDGTKFITGSVYKDIEDNGHCKVTLWDMENIKPLKDFIDDDGDYNGFGKIQLSSDNTLIGLASRGPINKIKIFDAINGNFIKHGDSENIGYNFEFLPFNYYVVYQEKDENNYGLNTYLYPEIFQSTIKRYGSRTIISKLTNSGEDGNNFIIFQALYQGMALLRNTTITSTPNEQVKQFTVKVEPEKITVNFDGAENVKIVDMFGNVLFNKTVSEPIISIPNIYPAGNYLCVVKSLGKKYTQKFQVVR